MTKPVQVKLRVRDERDEQIHMLIEALRYWLPKHRPFDGYVGSDDPGCKRHNAEWEKARALITAQTAHFTPAQITNIQLRSSIETWNSWSE